MSKNKVGVHEGTRSSISIIWDGTKTNQHVIAPQIKTMNTCENFPLKESSKQVLVGAPWPLGASTIKRTTFTRF
jgi:hypothetical protein